MLGKGLESLIPSSGKSGGSSGSADDLNNGVADNSGALFNDNSGVKPMTQKNDLDFSESIGGENSESQSQEDLVAETVKSTPTPSLGQDFDRQGLRQNPTQARLRNETTAGQAPRQNSAQAIFQIEVDKIKSNPHQPRRDFDQEAIKELAGSIREVGILQPLVVTKVEKETPSGTEVEYILIAGERRLLASKLLGLERVPAIVRRLDFERERLEIAIIENIQRENLNPIETARAFSRLQDEFGLTQREIATRLGKSREGVANSVRLLDLPAYIQEALANNQISETHGRLLLSITDPAIQKRLFDDILEKKLTTREVKNRVEFGGAGEKDKKDYVALEPELKMFQDQLTSRLGAPVRIEQKNSETGGKITIRFFSEEELRGILEKLGD